MSEQGRVPIVRNEHFEQTVAEGRSVTLHEPTVDSFFEQWQSGEPTPHPSPGEPAIVWMHEGGEWESDDGTRIVYWRRSRGGPTIIDWDSDWPFWRRWYVRLRGIR